jgi:hypothetical protein
MKELGINQPWHLQYHTGMLQCNGCAFTAITEDEMITHCERCPADTKKTLWEVRGYEFKEVRR